MSHYKREDFSKGDHVTIVYSDQPFAKARLGVVTDVNRGAVQVDIEGEAKRKLIPFRYVTSLTKRSDLRRLRRKPAPKPSTPLTAKLGDVVLAKVQPKQPEPEPEPTPPQSPPSKPVEPTPEVTPMQQPHNPLVTVKLREATRCDQVGAARVFVACDPEEVFVTPLKNLVTDGAVLAVQLPLNKVLTTGRMIDAVVVLHDSSRSLTLGELKADPNAQPKPKSQPRPQSTSGDDLDAVAARRKEPEPEPANTKGDYASVLAAGQALTRIANRATMPVLSAAEQLEVERKRAVVVDMDAVLTERVRALDALYVLSGGKPWLNMPGERLPARSRTHEGQRAARRAVPRLRMLVIDEDHQADLHKALVNYVKQAGFEHGAEILRRVDFKVKAD